MATPEYTILTLSLSEWPPAPPTLVVKLVERRTATVGTRTDTRMRTQARRRTPRIRLLLDQLPLRSTTSKAPKTRNWSRPVRDPEAIAITGRPTRKGTIQPFHRVVWAVE